MTKGPAAQSRGHQLPRVVAYRFSDDGVDSESDPSCDHPLNQDIMAYLSNPVALGAYGFNPYKPIGSHVCRELCEGGTGIAMNLAGDVAYVGVFINWGHVTVDLNPLHGCADVDLWELPRSRVEDALTTVLRRFGQDYTCDWSRLYDDSDDSGGVEQASCVALNAGGTDAYVMKLSASGAFPYGAVLGGYSEESGLGLALDQQGSIYVTGAFQYTVSLNSADQYFADPTYAICPCGIRAVADCDIGLSVRNPRLQRTDPYSRPYGPRIRMALRVVKAGAQRHWVATEWGLGRSGA